MAVQLERKYWNIADIAKVQYTFFFLLTVIFSLEVLQGNKTYKMNILNNSISVQSLLICIDIHFPLGKHLR